MLNEGHKVGHHSVTHPSFPGADDATLESELMGLENKMMEKFNIGFDYLRPPMGEYSERTIAATQQMGYKTVFWSFAYRDWEVDKQKGPDHAYDTVMKNLHNGAVILLHAVSEDNALALDRIIKGIREKGYELMPFEL
jgi:peptidoglycan-N-acetylmuramic acid deacetylase